MNNGLWHYRHAAVLGLAALLAGCGGGGGGSTAATCTADCISGQVTDSSGGGVSGVYVNATNPATGQVCSTSVDKTSSAGTYSLSASNCGGSTVVVTAPVGSGGSGTVVNSCTPNQACNLNPETTASIAAYVGTWAATYSSTATGGDSGICTVTVKQDGSIDASANNCSSNLSGKFTLSGSLDSQGNFIGTATTGAKYTGKFTPPTATASGAAHGQWSNSSTNPPGSGTWTASLN